MHINIDPLLNNLLPAALAVKGISKLNPKFQSFITSALAAGYSADQALDYLRSQINPEGQQEQEQDLRRAAARGNARPDELAALQEIGREDLPADIFGGVAKLGAAALGGKLGAGLGRKGAISPYQVLPPESAAMQLPAPAQRPQIGMQERGFTMKPSPPTPQGPIAGAAPPPRAQLPGPTGMVPSGGEVAGGGLTPFDFLAQYDPNLAQTMLYNIQNGLPPDKAAKVAKGATIFHDPIKEIEEDTGETFEEFIQRLFGGKKKSKARGKGLEAQAPEAAMGGGGGLGVTQGNQAPPDQARSQAMPQGANRNQRMQQMAAILQGLQGLRRG